MKLKFKKFKLFIITILIGMVFAVNIGFTFATNTPEYSIVVNSETGTVDEANKRRTYLNDVVVNNTTTNIPIAYKQGTMQREINFDYSFSDSTDYAVSYELKYTDGTTADNVLLNFVNRDNFIVDQEVVQMGNYVTAYNSSAPKGTLFAINPLIGVGTLKLFSGVTFLTGNNKVDEYISTSATSFTIGNKEYSSNDPIGLVAYQYTQLEVSRYWEVFETNSLGKPISYVCRTSYTVLDANNSLTIPSGVILKTADYENYVNSSVGVYTASYTVAKEFKVDTTTYPVGHTFASSAEVEALSKENRNNVKVQLSNPNLYWIKAYKCIASSVEIDSVTYSYGQLIDEATYTGLSANKDKFETCYTKTEPYSVRANENIITTGNTIAVNQILTAEEYKLLSVEEQAKFAINKYTNFENKNLQITIKVHTAVAFEDEQKYTAEHSFASLKTSHNSLAFDNWLSYKNSGGSLASNIAMIYNGHAKFENAIPYATDFSSGEDMTTVLANAKTNLTSSYIYKTTEGQTKFYSYAGGNKYNAGVGVYYLTANSATTLTVTVSANWYNSNGDKISSMPVNNINLQFANGQSSFSKLLPANSYGYLDILDYVQTITEGDLFDMTGYSLVITAISASFANSSSSATAEDKSITLTNSSSYNPVLYTLSQHQGIGGNLDVNITVTNNSNDAIALPNVVLSPKFIAYNGYSGVNVGGGQGYGIANTVRLGFSTTSYKANSAQANASFNFDNSIWKCASSGNNYTFSASTTGLYIAPGASLAVISGVNIPATVSNATDWSFDLDQTTNIDMLADYWFDIETNYTASSATINYSASSTYKSAEIMTSLQDTEETGSFTSYIAIRNNSLQTLTAVSYQGALIANNNSSTSVNYSGSSSGTFTKSGNSFTVTLTGLDLKPGETMYICKLTITAGANLVKLSKNEATATLQANLASSSGIYFKRDFASGNLSIINLSTADSNLTINGLTDLLGGTEKWSATNKFIMQDEADSQAKFRKNQMIHLKNDITENISGYSYSAN